MLIEQPVPARSPPMNALSPGARSLLIYMPGLGGGGVERFRLLLASSFMEAGYSVTFLLHTTEGELTNSVPPGVKVVSLECRRTLTALMPMVRFLRQEKPDILLSSLGHNNIMAIWTRALARVPTRVVVTQHNALSVEHVQGQELKYWLLPLVSRLFLRFADGIVAVSKGVADDLAAITHVPRRRVTVAYNPVVAEDFDGQTEEPIMHPWLDGEGPPVILGVGRFVEQKDFATLIAAFAALVKKKDARLILLGEGPLRDELRMQAQQLGVADRVDMPGFYKNPLPFIRRAAILALSSRFEGFGNVLVEALACGTQVVSTDCTFGPAEILAHGEYGRLVPVGDAPAMAEALEAAFAQPFPEDTLRARGHEFTVERAAHIYLDLFDELLAA